MSDDYEEKIVALLKEILKTNEVTALSEVGRPYQWDSLKHISIMLKVESHFKIVIGPAKIADLSSVQKISEFIREAERAL